MTRPPIPEGRVLPTLNQDGTRRRLDPQLYRGRTYFARLGVGYGLIALFVGLPFVEIAGRPAVFLDVVRREFTFFGRTFFATDGVLLMLLMLSIFVAILWITAVFGRAWCGYGCPQTVYMELVYRPIERLFHGGRGKRPGGLAKAGKLAVFALLSVLLANVFLSYFVSVATLERWVTHPPTEHWGGFLVMAVTAGLVFFDFAYFREQMCTVICPYARLQSALLDRDSLLIAYDEKRGEPRKKGKWTPGGGDCIDCGACTRTCPTGIDIREGLQLECIACGQCADACDSIMDKIERPRGLIGYATKRSLEEGKRRFVRPRVLIYTLLLGVLVGALSLFTAARRDVDVTILRGIGAPYVVTGDKVQNQLRVKVENRSRAERSFVVDVSVRVDGRSVPARELGIEVVNPESPLVVEPENRRTTTLFVLTPTTRFVGGQLPLVVTVREGADAAPLELPYKLLGPMSAGKESQR